MKYKPKRQKTKRTPVFMMVKSLRFPNMSLAVPTNSTLQGYGSTGGQAAATSYGTSYGGGTEAAGNGSYGASGSSAPGYGTGAAAVADPGGYGAYRGAATTQGRQDRSYRPY